MGADGSRVSTFCFSILLLFRLDVINLAKYKSSAFIYKFNFGLPGRTEQHSPTSPSPARCMQPNSSTPNFYQ
jgi:hypothetical protein